jgi:hypothetical protein
MSTIYIAACPGDAARLEAVLRARTDDFNAIAQYAKSKGCLHRRFLAGNEEIVLIAEWQDIETAVRNVWFLPEAASVLREAGLPPPHAWSDMIKTGHYRSIADPTEF